MNCPLIASDGSKIGTFCLFDDEPRKLDDEQRELLRDLARLAAATVERDRADARLRADEDALRESERRMALAIAGSGTGIWDRNVRTNEIHYSPGWKAILGYADSEITCPASAATDYGNAADGRWSTNCADRQYRHCRDECGRCER
jgi:PAS domain-containing protein